MEGQIRHAVFIFQAFSANSASNSVISANSACLAEAKTAKGGRALRARPPFCVLWAAKHALLALMALFVRTIGALFALFVSTIEALFALFDALFALNAWKINPA